MALKISHHAREDFVAEISFFTWAKWKEELLTLLSDIHEDGVQPDVLNNLKSDVEAVWAKVSSKLALPSVIALTVAQVKAIHPEIQSMQAQLNQLTVDNILALKSGMYTSHCFCL